jgi:formate hydrogenlyase maturation protein HycH
MPERVVFHQLSRKFVHRGHDVPAASKQLIHYTLAIGHHIGIIDCFSTKLELSRDEYARWVARLPTGEARHKLEGLLRFGEIEIAAPHVRVLQDALNAGANAMGPEETEWAARLHKMLETIAEEPAIYLMVRCRP